MEEELIKTLEEFNRELEVERARLYNKYFTKEYEGGWDPVEGKHIHENGIYTCGATRIGVEANRYGIPTLQFTANVYKDGELKQYGVTLSGHSMIDKIESGCIK